MSLIGVLIGLFSLSIIELIIPLGFLGQVIKYLLVVLVLLTMINKKITYQTAIVSTILGIISVGYLYFPTSQLIIHFILLQIILVLIVNLTSQLTSVQMQRIVSAYLSVIIALVFLKFLVATNFIFNLNISLLNSIFDLMGGGSISLGNGIHVPRITFGPEFIFLIVYLLLDKDKFRSNSVLASLLLSMSRSYLILIIAHNLIIKRKIFLTLIVGSIIIYFITSSSLLELRDINEVDIRFAQWEIAKEVFLRNMFFGSPGDYMRLFLNGHPEYLSANISECEFCQIISDCGLFFSTAIFVLPIYFIVKSLSVKWISIVYVYILLAISALFNPVFSTFAYVSTIVVFSLSQRKDCK